MKNKETVYPTQAQIKCDARDCKNIADCFVEVKGRTGRIFFCKDCLDAIADSVLSKRAPKSPKNTIKKIIDSKKDGNE